MTIRALQRRSRLTGVLMTFVLALIAGVPAAHARDATVTSFDGTHIATSFFPAEGLQPGQKAPTVLVGPRVGRAS